MVLWSYGPVVLWSYGPVVLWSYGPVVLWSCVVVYVCKQMCARYCVISTCASTGTMLMVCSVTVLCVYV